MSEQKAWTVETLKAYYPDDLRKLLTFEEVGDIIKVSVTKFMHGPEGTKTWNIMNKLTKQAGGAWKSLGKQSHWAVPKFQSDTEAHARLQKRLEDIKDAAKFILTEVDEALK